MTPSIGSSSDYVAVISYEITKRLSLPRYFYYALAFIDNTLILYMLSYEFQHIFYDELDADGLLVNRGKSIYLRDIIHERISLTQKQVAIHTLSLFYIILTMLLIVFNVVIIKNDNLLRKPTQ